MDESEPRIKRARQPSEDEASKLGDLTHAELMPRVARLFLLPENPTRQAYTVLREIYLTTYDAWWDVIWSLTKSNTGEQLDVLFPRLLEIQDKLTELQSWLIPPRPPLSLEAAAELIKNTKSDVWRESILKGVGKRRRAGQPASKRYLALRAVDIKCAYPETSLRDATDILCPCGKEEHTPKCREQLRQQINRLVKLLREHGYDFTWERIKDRGWKVLSE